MSKSAFGLFDQSMFAKINRLLKPFGVVLRMERNVNWGDQVKITAEPMLDSAVEKRDREWCIAGGEQGFACLAATNGPIKMTPVPVGEAQHSLYLWLKERRENALRIAETKSGGDRTGWLEDAEQFDAAMGAVLEVASLRLAAQERELEARDDERQACWEDVIHVIRNANKDSQQSFELRALHEAIFQMGWKELGTGDGKPMHMRADSAVNEWRRTR